MTSTQSLVVDDRDKGLFRVHRSVFTSEDIFKLEQENIFSRSWLYVGHESEIPNANDFQFDQDVLDPQGKISIIL